MSPPTALLQPIGDARVTLDSVIGQRNIGETAPVSSAVHRAVVSSYLLAWSLLLNLFRSTSSEQRVHYAQYIRRTSLVDRLMSDVFHLLPNSPIIPVSNALLSQPPPGKVCTSSSYRRVPAGQGKLEKSGNLSGQGKIRGEYILEQSGKMKNWCHQMSDFFRLKCIKFGFGWGSSPDLAGGAYSTPPHTLAALNIAP